MADGCVAVSKLRVAERFRGLQVVQMVSLAIVGDPEIPHPVVVLCECHRANTCWCVASKSWRRGAIEGMKESLVFIRRVARRGGSFLG